MPLDLRGAGARDRAASRRVGDAGGVSSGTRRTDRVLSRPQGIAVRALRREYSGCRPAGVPHFFLHHSGAERRALHCNETVMFRGLFAWSRLPVRERSPNNFTQKRFLASDWYGCDMARIVRGRFGSARRVASRACLATNNQGGESPCLTVDCSSRN